MGVSLVAIAAIVASLAVARQRHEEGRAEPPQPAPERSPAAPALDLEGIRAAGW